MTTKNTIQKPVPSADDFVRAQLRKVNLTSDAELKVLMTIAESMGFTVTYDEKTGELSINPCGSVLQKVSSQSIEQDKDKCSESIDEEKLARKLQPFIDQTIRASVINNYSNVTATVDSSVLIKNNDAVMKDLNGRLDEWIKLFKDKLIPSTSNSDYSTYNGSKQSMRLGSDHSNKEPGREPAVAPRGRNWATEKLYKLVNFLKPYLARWYEDMISSFRKTAAYIVCLCSIICCIHLWYKNYRMENIVKEYGIMKPALMDHPFYRSFIQTLDSALVNDDIDDIIDRIQKNQHK